MASKSRTNLATALLLLLGVSYEARCSRTPGLENIKRTPHSLFIDTRTQQWENVTNIPDNNKTILNNITLNKPLNEISLKEYLAVHFRNINIKNNKSYINNTDNNNNSNKNESKYINSDNNNNDSKMKNTKRNDNNITVNTDIADSKESGSKNEIEFPSVIENRVLFNNVFKSQDFAPHNDKSPHLIIDKDSQITTQLVNTWAKMRRSAVLSSDAQIMPQTGDGTHRGDVGKRSEVAEDLRQKFNVFKEFLATTTKKSPSETNSPKRGTENLFVERRKTVRKAGEVIGMVESGVLPESAHPILFLPTPQRTVIEPSLRRGGPTGAMIGQTAGRGRPVGGSFTGRLRLGSSRTPSHISRMPGDYVSPLQSSAGMSPELVRLLQARLGSTSRRVHYDSSIIVDFLTLVSLSQRHNSGDSGDDGRSRTSQREATMFRSSDLTSLPLMSISSRRSASNQPNGGHHNHGEFGPFSNGNDPAAGIDPSNIEFPPELRQTLYSYLLPRLPALGALLDTVPGVPGLDYPIIGAVPYTNFYCLDMPWPGFYADTEARCQTWHYCDLEGRQSSFLCPNGTVFNQAFLVCDWWYNFDCQTAPFLYSINERVFDVPEIDETAPHRTLTPEILDSLFV